MDKQVSEIIKTKDILNALKSFAEENLTTIDKCDFIINSIDTYLKDSSDQNFRLLTQEALAQHKNKKSILNNNVEFEQVYDITVTLKNSSALNLKKVIKHDSDFINPYMIISPISQIPHKKYKPIELYNLLKQELNKLKAQHNFIIDLFDEEMVKYLKILTKYIYAGKFVKNVKIPLFNGIEPELSSESKLIMWFMQKEASHQIIEVEADELLVEYKKPIYGKKGFNAFGKLIDAGYGEKKNDLSAEVDLESIKIVETDLKKLYKSKAKGFVHYTEKLLTVDNKVKMDALSRVQASLAKEEANNIEVMVSQDDTTKDSVGEGVELTSETIHINGHIGANSILEATHLRVDGATHQDSTQFAKYATINRHKGKLRCHEAKIKLLEGGVIHATTADIESALGGSVYAQDVTIGLVKSNLKVYASHSITIRMITGEDNILKINYQDIPIIKSKLDLINEDVEDLKYKLEEASRHNRSEVEKIQNQIQLYRDEQKSIRTSYLNASITIEKPLRGLNTIIFTISNSNEIVYKTDAKQYEPFSIEIEDDKVTLLPVNKHITLS